MNSFNCEIELDRRLKRVKQITIEKKKNVKILHLCFFSFIVIFMSLCFIHCMVSFLKQRKSRIENWILTWLLRWNQISHNRRKFTIILSGFTWFYISKHWKSFEWTSSDFGTFGKTKRYKRLLPEYAPQVSLNSRVTNK